MAIIDGKKIAQEIRNKLGKEASKLKEEGRAPGLSVVLVGSDPASETYVNMKKKAAQNLDIRSEVHQLEEDIPEAELFDLIDTLNNDNRVDGILVQLPLPEHINPDQVIEAIVPDKDVDGFHPLNTGRLFNGQQEGLRFEACTPLGIIELIERSTEIDGKKAVIVGRSNIVGKPTAHLLLDRHATVTICHSHTPDLKKETLQADILVAAAGYPRLISGDMVKEGATVIDVGINRVNGELVGDVNFDQAEKRAAHITPVPGGVGPMTITMLMENTIKARKYHGI
ncbi:MAG: bifunctional methylenetetrahydrofolate dehydrogenase/methenyltetrahydrofolate cyclohydrolase FolD [Bacillota bacterium]